MQIGTKSILYGAHCFFRRWAYEHADGRVDTWTGDKKELQDRQAGVWK